MVLILSGDQYSSTDYFRIFPCCFITSLLTVTSLPFCVVQVLFNKSLDDRQKDIEVCHAMAAVNAKKKVKVKQETSIYS